MVAHDRIPRQALLERFQRGDHLPGCVGILCAERSGERRLTHTHGLVHTSERHRQQENQACAACALASQKGVAIAP